MPVLSDFITTDIPLIENTDYFITGNQIYFALSSLKVKNTRQIVSSNKDLKSLYLSRFLSVSSVNITNPTYLTNFVPSSAIRNLTISNINTNLPVLNLSSVFKIETLNIINTPIETISISRSQLTSVSGITIIGTPLNESTATTLITSICANIGTNTEAASSITFFIDTSAYNITYNNTTTSYLTSLCSLGVSTRIQTPEPIYRITPSTFSINEGSTLSFILSTFYTQPGQIFYWTVSGNAGVNRNDFTAVSGSLTLVRTFSGNLNSSQIVVSADSFTEGPELFNILAKLEPFTPINIALAGPITINDISITPAEVPTSWMIGVNITAPGQTFSVNFVTGISPHFSIDWGEGNAPSVYTTTGVKTNTYSIIGILTTSISGQFNDEGSLRLGNTTAERSRVVSVSAIPNIPGLNSFYQTFNGCTNLSIIPDALFQNNSAVTTFEGTFQLCSNLSVIPATLFQNNTAVTTFRDTFNGCTNLSVIPDALFQNNSAVTTFERTFRNCSNLSAIPDTLFQNNTAVTNFNSTFLGCSRLSAIPAILFQNNRAVTGFNSTFNGCTNLSAIPATLFQNNRAVTDFNGIFQSCTNLSAIPDTLFQNNTAVTGFNSTFRNCSNLSAIPATLFQNNRAVTGFAATFESCINLSAIPDTLFQNNTAVTNFTNTFYGCTNLSVIPATLFQNNTAVTTFQQTFLGCSNLSAIPDTLFQNNRAVTSFYQAFLGCSTLTRVPSSLFFTNTAVETFHNCFTNVTLDTDSYSNLLINMASNSAERLNDVLFGGGNSKYNIDGQAARALLVSKGWSFTDGGYEDTTIAPVQSQVYRGEPALFNIYSDRPDGTVLFWDVSGINSDANTFDFISGGSNKYSGGYNWYDWAYIENNRNTIVVRTSSHHADESSFIVNLRESPGGPVIARSTPVQLKNLPQFSYIASIQIFQNKVIWPGGPAPFGGVTSIGFIGNYSLASIRGHEIPSDVIHAPSQQRSLDGGRTTAGLAGSIIRPISVSGTLSGLIAEYVLYSSSTTNYYYVSVFGLPAYNPFIIYHDVNSGSNVVNVNNFGEHFYRFTTLQSPNFHNMVLQRSNSYCNEKMICTDFTTLTAVSALWSTGYAQNTILYFDPLSGMGTYRTIVSAAVIS